MKAKKLIVAGSCTLFLLTGSVVVKAYSGSLSDSRVDMIWWSQGGGSNTYWTGVTNKLNYDAYKPCVGPTGSEYACGVAAGQSEYKEYGRWLSSTVTSVCHGLTSKTGNYETLSYPIDVTVKDTDR